MYEFMENALIIPPGVYLRLQKLRAYRNW